MTAEAGGGFVYATARGQRTIDGDARGGNPFASALIDVGAEPGLSLRPLLTALRRRTLALSHGAQRPEWQTSSLDLRWRLNIGVPARPERRVALVLVVSDYSAMGIDRLWGAAFDERRIAAMLAQHGFSVMQGAAPQRKALLQALARFRRTSAHAEAALVYCTGHGLMAGDCSYLLPGDYPVARGYGLPSLRRHAIDTRRLVQACASSRLNLAFFAGCRNVEPSHA